MIPRALLLLIRLKSYSQIRRHFLKLKRPRHAVYSLVGLLGMSVILAAPWYPLHIPEVNEWVAKTRINPAIVSTVMFLLAVRGLIFTPRTSAFHFSPGEIEFLFPGPFSRRQLLVYRIASDVSTLAIIAILVSSWLFLFTSSYVQVYLGVLLGIIFIEYLPMVVTIVRLTLVEGAYSLAKKAILSTAFLLFAVAILRTVLTRGVGSLVEKFRVFQDSWAGTCLLAPFEVFSRFIAARTFREATLWGTLALLVNLALFSLILWLDANYLETALASSQSAYDRLQNKPAVRASAKNSRRKWILWRPQGPPYWGGAGAIAWRQLIATVRRSPTEYRFMPLLVVAVGIFFATVAGPGIETGILSRYSQEVIIFFEAFIILNLGMVAAANPFDFRNDIKQMDSLKTLPCPPIILVLGELAAPAFMVACWMLLFSLCGIIANHRLLAQFVAAPAIGFPLTLLFLICENIAALYFPMPQKEGAPGLGDYIRAMLMVFVRWFLYFLMTVFFLGIGTLCYYFVGRSWLAGIAALWVMIAPVAFWLVHVLAAVFERFDPSRDIPRD